MGKIIFSVAVMTLLALLSGCIEKERLWSGVNNGDIFDEPDDRLDGMLDQLAKADLRVIRVWVDLRLEMDENGEPLPVGSYNDCILDQIDNLMVKTKKKGILLLITLHQYNWIDGNSLPISQDFYEWRKCKTPVNVYQRVLRTSESEYVYDPYYERGWGSDYLTDTDAKDAYRQRVNHILNHVNPHFRKPWKEINDVVWAWELQNEPEYLPGSNEDLTTWLNEMATYVKSIDPNTYVALGTMGWWGWGNIQDADIYTIHWYGSPDGLGDSIRQFQEEIGRPYGKLLLMEEFNPLFVSTGVAQRRRHTPERKSQFEATMEECRRNKVPWMFWEYGYWFDGDDIWHANKVTAVGGKPVAWPDGILWGAKVLPGAKNIWITSWPPTEKKWKVHNIVDALCSQRGADCDIGRPIYFLDTFSAGPLGSGYRWFDEGGSDSYSLVDEPGYLRIEAGYGQDLWGGTPVKTGAPLLLRPAPGGDYWVETFVRADDPGEEVLHEPMPHPAQPINTQLGLFVFQDVDNWIFFGLTYHDFTIGDTRVQGDGLIVTVTENGVSSIVEENNILADFMFLRIERQGDNWKFYWKTEHIHGWSLLTTVNLALTDHEVGMGVKTFDLFPQLFGPCKAYFDYFLIGQL